MLENRGVLPVHVKNPRWEIPFPQNCAAVITRLTRTTALWENKCVQQSRLLMYNTADLAKVTEKIIWKTFRVFHRYAAVPIGQLANWKERTVIEKRNYHNRWFYDHVLHLPRNTTYWSTLKGKGKKKNSYNFDETLCFSLSEFIKTRVSSGFLNIPLFHKHVTC